MDGSEERGIFPTAHGEGQDEREENSKIGVSSKDSFHGAYGQGQRRPSMNWTSASNQQMEYRANTTSATSGWQSGGPSTAVARSFAPGLALKKRRVDPYDPLGVLAPVDEYTLMKEKADAELSGAWTTIDPDDKQRAYDSRWHSDRQRMAQSTPSDASPSPWDMGRGGDAARDAADDNGPETDRWDGPPLVDPRYEDPDLDVDPTVRDKFRPIGEVLQERVRPRSLFETRNKAIMPIALSASSMKIIRGGQVVKTLHPARDNRGVHQDRYGNYIGRDLGPMKKHLVEDRQALIKQRDEEIVRATREKRRWDAMNPGVKQALGAKRRPLELTYQFGPGAFAADVFDLEAMPEVYTKKVSVERVRWWNQARVTGILSTAASEDDGEGAPDISVSARASSSVAEDLCRTRGPRPSSSRVSSDAQKGTSLTSHTANIRPDPDLTELRDIEASIKTEFNEDLAHKFDIMQMLSATRGRIVSVTLHQLVQFSPYAVVSRIFRGVIQEVQLHPDRRMALVVFVFPSEAEDFVEHIQSLRRRDAHAFRQHQIDVEWYGGNERQAIYPIQRRIAIKILQNEGISRELQILKIPLEMKKEQFAEEMKWRLRKPLASVALGMDGRRYVQSVEKKFGVIEFLSIRDAVEAMAKFRGGDIVGYGSDGALASPLGQVQFRAIPGPPPPCAPNTLATVSEGHQDVTLTPDSSPSNTPRKPDPDLLRTDQPLLGETLQKAMEPVTTEAEVVEDVQAPVVEETPPAKTELTPKRTKKKCTTKSCKGHGHKSGKDKGKKKKVDQDSSSDDSSSSDESDDDASDSDSSDEDPSDSESAADARRAKRPKTSRSKRQKKLRSKGLRKGKHRPEVDSSPEASSVSEQSSSSESEVEKPRKSKKSKSRRSKKHRRAPIEDSADDTPENDAANILAQIETLNATLATANLGSTSRRGRRANRRRSGLAIKGKPGRSKKQKRGSKLEFKRVDQLWDTSIHDYKLTDTAEYEDGDEYDQYIFTVRRKFDWEGKYTDTVIDIRSKILREVLASVMDGVKGVSLVEETPVVDPNMLFLYLEETRAVMKALKKQNKTERKKKVRKANDRKAAQLKVLIKYLDEDYADTKKTLYPLLDSNTITFDLLWALFKPNTIAYTTTYGNADEPRAFKIEYATKNCSFMRGSWYTIEGRYLEYDGKSFGMGTMDVEVDSFKGPRRIPSLATYPLQYHKDPDGLRQQLIERGRKFVALTGMKYRFHRGMAFTKKKRAVVKVNINGRIMIDPAIHRRVNPNYQISTVRPKNLDEDPDYEDSEDDSCCQCGSDEDEDEHKGGKPAGDDEAKTKRKWKVFEDEKGDVHVEKVEVEVDSDGEEVVKQKLENLDEKKEDAFTDEELLVASPVVLGFAFSEKTWLEFTVSGVKDIEWNEGAFDSLVLPDNQKSIVKALVESHTFHAAQSIDDVIQGKGRGLVAVLHGPPGTGKTLTAEGIAELLKCPLYMVSAGELGTDPRTLETELNRILDIAHSWGAVLLLDEADVFLEKRTIQDIHRNALVSIFLRLLEYFQGILFLTTNRVETFDDAFQSRIHIALRYGELTTKAKKTVWKMFLEKVRAMEGVEMTPFTEENFDTLARNNLNGRQIKNCVRTAQALAVNQREKLSMTHIRRVLDVAESFDHDLKGGTGYIDAMRSYT
ncbi:MAG: hypothetical protein M1838_005213 [Thelocarpon superellum]|nr:MAG: hypothetical protein M1838_005213 [Thelocarpon superellum]